MIFAYTQLIFSHALNILVFCWQISNSQSEAQKGEKPMWPHPFPKLTWKAPGKLLASASVSMVPDWGPYLE